jgi:hypothetical protein
VARGGARVQAAARRSAPQRAGSAAGAAKARGCIARRPTSKGREERDGGGGASGGFGGGCRGKQKDCFGSTIVTKPSPRRALAASKGENEWFKLSAAGNRNAIISGICKEKPIWIA